MTGFSLFAHAPTYLSAEPPKLYLSQRELTNISNSLQRKRRMWTAIISGLEDEAGWVELLCFVLTGLTGGLSALNLGDRFVGALTGSAAEELLGKFSDKELEDWKSAVLKVVEKNDWEDLVSHRTSSAYLTP